MKFQARLLIPIIALLFSGACNGEMDSTLSSTPTDAATESRCKNPPQVQSNISVEVTDIECWSGDLLHFVGMLENTGTVGVQFVEIEVTLLDSAGQKIESETSFAYGYVIPVGEKSPFNVTFFGNTSGWQDYEINVMGDQASGFVNPYLDFEFLSSTGSEDCKIPYVFGVTLCAYEIVGEIRNIGSRDADTVQMAAVIYDSNNHIIGFGYGPDDLVNIPAGDTSPFTVYVLNKAPGAIDHYELWAFAD